MMAALPLGASPVVEGHVLTADDAERKIEPYRGVVSEPLAGDHRGVGAPDGDGLAVRGTTQAGLQERLLRQPRRGARRRAPDHRPGNRIRDPLYLEHVPEPGGDRLAIVVDQDRPVGDSDSLLPSTAMLRAREMFCRQEIRYVTPSSKRQENPSVIGLAFSTTASSRVRSGSLRT